MKKIKIEKRRIDYGSDGRPIYYVDWAHTLEKVVGIDEVRNIIVRGLYNYTIGPTATDCGRFLRSFSGREIADEICKEWLEHLQKQGVIEIVGE